MIRRKGDMFTTSLKAIGHGVNCAGVMGAGIAKPIRAKYPNNYRNYRALCQNKGLNPGGLLTVTENGMTIFNMATQRQPGRDARYDAVFASGFKAANTALNMGLDSIAIPMIGCGIGGLEWDKVESILLCVEDITENFEWEVWKL